MSKKAERDELAEIVSIKHWPDRSADAILAAGYRKVPLGAATQVIPEPAVEAAARKLFQSTMDEPWEVAYPEQEAHFRECARGILEAAAPHMK